jgi:hypothetical protein
MVEGAAVNELCIIENCGRKRLYKVGYCGMHYQRVARGWNPDNVDFVIPGQMYGKEQCTVPGCVRKYVASGYCRMHYDRMKREMDVTSPEFLSTQSYRCRAVRLTRYYPHYKAGNLIIFYHIEKAEQVLGRRLKKNEVVHHVNGDKTNYSNDNLVVMSRSYHREHFVRLHPWLFGGDAPDV